MLLVTMFILTVVGWRLSALHRDDFSWRTEYDYRHEAWLFRECVDFGLIKAGPDGHLAILDDDTEGSGPAEISSWLTPTSLSRLLSDSFSGQFIRREVERYNQGKQIAAIRDNRPASVSGPDDAPWKIRKVDNPEWGRVAFRKSVPIAYGFVCNRVMRSGFNNWQLAATSDSRVIFRSTITVPVPSQVVIQVIGRPVGITPGYARSEPRCKDAKSCLAGNAEAAEIFLDLPAGSHPVQVVVDAVAARIGPSDACIRDKDAGLDFRCPQPAGARKDSLPEKTVRIESSDGVTLTDETGKPTAFAREMGLGPLLGDPSMPDTLAGILRKNSASLGTDPSVTLTIDSEAQRQAFEIFRGKINEFWHDRDVYGKNRRGALVVTDEKGRIRVAVSYSGNLPLTRISPWDLEVFGMSYRNLDPTRIFAWQVLDRHSAPGSSFKPVVLLAAHTDDEGPNAALIKHLIVGYTEEELDRHRPGGIYADAAQYRAGSGTFYKAGQRQPNLISNFHAKSFRDHINNSRLRFGAVDAMRYSTNIYFARMAELVSAAHLKKTLEDLGIGARNVIDLASNVPSGLLKYRRKPFKTSKGSLQGGDVLFGYLGDADIVHITDSQQYRHSVAYAGIGTGVQTSVLQMARLFAFFASGELIDPYIIDRIAGKPLPSSRKAGIRLSQGTTALMRRALKSPMEAGGTAAEAFRGYSGTVYGKTGTSQVDPHYNSAWFTGWREDGDGKRLIVSCFVSHVHGGRRLGGNSCGPIVAEVLKKLR